MSMKCYYSIFERPKSPKSEDLLKSIELYLYPFSAHVSCAIGLFPLAYLVPHAVSSISDLGILDDGASVLELFILLEGVEPRELPERLLGGLTLCRIDLRALL